MKNFISILFMLILVGCGSPISKKEAAEGFMALLKSSVNISIDSYNNINISEEDITGYLEGKIIEKNIDIINLKFETYKKSIICNNNISTTEFDGEIKYIWSYNDEINIEFTLELFGTLTFNGASCTVITEVIYNRIEDTFDFTGSVCGFNALEIREYLNDNQCTFE